MQPELLFYS